MNTEKNCEEYTGLFIVKTCENIASSSCDNCQKAICKTHLFDAKFLNITNKTSASKSQDLCLSCFVGFDTRLTKQIEVYSKDRAIWRRKMMQRFHEEYPYMQFLADDFSSLFDVTSIGYMNDSLEDGSYFDS